MGRGPKEMLYEKYFPKKENPEMPDDIWQTYAMEVWGLNSFNALETYYRHLASDNKQFKSNLRVISKDDAKMTCRYLERAQIIISCLLEETGRADKFREWRRNRKNDFKRRNATSE